MDPIRNIFIECGYRVSRRTLEVKNEPSRCQRKGHALLPNFEDSTSKLQEKELTRSKTTLEQEQSQ